MTDPYLIEGPALISFSGGRTSAYLLKHVLDAYGGTLPGNVIACFANTGKEMPQTLDFVRDCGRDWRWQRRVLRCRSRGRGEPHLRPED